MSSELMKAKLSVILKAGEEIVAESDDAELWQRVLSAILGKPAKPLDPAPAESGQAEGTSGSGLGSDGTLLERFANFLKVDVNQLQGACDPVEEEPFMHLDHSAWADWRKRTPERGRAALSAVGIAATLLTLWFKEMKLGNVTFAQISKVLDEIGATYTNPTRSVKNCTWLQLKGNDQVRLHPSHIDKAVAAAQSFIASDNQGD